MDNAVSLRSLFDLDNAALCKLECPLMFLFVFLPGCLSFTLSSFSIMYPLLCIFAAQSSSFLFFPQRFSRYT